ncbi:MAG: hypothetical protein ACNA7O_03165 [Rhodobacterales bacterium]
MTLPNLATQRFVPEKGLRVIVQVPEVRAQQIIDAVLGVTTLRYGDYDSVTFTSTVGKQRFRSLGSGRNKATETVVAVPCVEVSFFLSDDEAQTTQVIEAIYAVHPYEEPVIFIETCLRTRHIRGLDEDNPNRFWNSKTQDWVPESQR